MPRRAKGPRLYLRQRAGREPIWVIRDGGFEESTSCLRSDLAGAESRLAAYLTQKYEPPLTRFVVAEAEGTRLALLEMVALTASVEINSLDVPAATARGGAKALRQTHKSTKSRVGGWVTTIRRAPVGISS